MKKILLGIYILLMVIYSIHTGYSSYRSNSQLKGIACGLGGLHVLADQNHSTKERYVSKVENLYAYCKRTYADWDE